MDVLAPGIGQIIGGSERIGHRVLRAGIVISITAGTTAIA